MSTTKNQDIKIEYCDTWDLNHHLQEAIKIKRRNQNLGMPLESMLTNVADEIFNDRNKIIEVALLDNEVIGYLIKKADKACSLIEECEVTDGFSKSIFIKNEIEKRPYLFAIVDENNLTLQILYRSLGFRAKYIKREFSSDGSDAYVFMLTKLGYPTPDGMGYNNCTILDEVMDGAEKLVDRSRTF